MPTAPTAIGGFRGFCSWSGKKSRTSSRECNRSPPLNAGAMRLAHCRASRRGSPNRTDTGGSALPGERVFVPPHLPLAIPVGIGSGGWKPVTPEQVTIMPSGAILRRDYNPPDRLDNAFSGFGLTRLPSGGREFRRHHFSHHEFLYFVGCWNASNLRGGTASMPFREKRPDERVFRQLVPLSRPVCRADWRKNAGLFAYSPGVHCRDGLPAGGKGIRTLSPSREIGCTRI